MTEFMAFIHSTTQEKWKCSTGWHIQSSCPMRGWFWQGSWWWWFTELRASIECTESRRWTWTSLFGRTSSMFCIGGSLSDCCWWRVVNYSIHWFYPSIFNTLTWFTLSMFNSNRSNWTFIVYRTFDHSRMKPLCVWRGLTWITLCFCTLCHFWCTAICHR